SDVPSILLLIQRATNGAVKLKRAELLMSLGDRGYLIGQRGTEISVIAGWSSENLVARIDQFYVYPPDALEVTGTAALQEIEDTANELICECILAFPPHDVPADVRQLFERRGYVEVDREVLPAVWKTAAEESQPPGTFVLLKKLRDTRITSPV
ncbi:MAG: hypothetical protein L0322_31095, partial [Chloroflexi bacterium]|nr:hypothetical protein [Chloroflexota bacterium]